jgi:glycosyltransferase involved in cell wall biosynthesis
MALNRYKICVYAICKNEEKFTDRWMDSMQEADLVVVTDTGSTDDTAERLRARGAEVHIRTVTPWRFDTARNISLSFVPEDADICVCTDLDEVLSPGWRDALEKAWADGTKRAYYLYNWSFRKDGTPDVTFMYSKAHTRHDYRWVCPFPEVLEYIGQKPEISVTIDGMGLTR